MTEFLPTPRILRLRINYNLHESLDDTTHRFFNAIEPGAIVPIHRHRDAVETFFLVRGKMRVVFYDDDKSIIEKAILSADNGNYGVHIPAEVWYWVEIRVANTETFEVKEGPYHSLTDEDIMK